MSHFRIIIGLAVTSTWFTCVGVYVFFKWSELAAMEPNALGDFVAGAAGPVAFLWLVLGYFQQGEELGQNTAALKLQADELRASVEQQKALVVATERQHKFELDREQLRRKTSFLAKQPYFRVEMNFEELVDRVDCWSITVKNTGHRCTNVWVGSTEIQVDSEIVESLETGKDNWWYAEVKRRPITSSSVIFIGYVDGNQEAQMQEVEVRIEPGPSGSPAGVSVQKVSQIFPWERSTS